MKSYLNPTARILLRCITYIYDLFDILFPYISKNPNIEFSFYSREKNIRGLPFVGIQTFTYKNILYALKYKNNHVRDMMWKFKYFLNPREVRICTYILYDLLVADVSDRVLKIPFRTPYIVIHYPSSSYFRGKKKFDHMKELTLNLDCMQNVSDPFFTYCTHAILPNQSALQILASQHTGNRRQRFEWSKERFILSKRFERYMETYMKSDVGSDSENPSLITQDGRTQKDVHRQIYCIDDIVTTGASMQSVSKLIKEKFDVEVIQLCICH